MSVATPSTVPISTYNEFWLHYLREHSKPQTRALHYFGTTAGLVLWTYALWTHTFRLLPVGLFTGYFCAWVGHFFVEHNKPATFKYPGWSFISDWVMLGYWASGNLQPQLKQAGVSLTTKLV
ncbi:hypothetical protein WJX79_002243 [Trebouxia sp. C0005]